MPYLINHVHIRSANPSNSADWYAEHFGATKVSEREVMPGTVTISMDMGSPVRLNISSQVAGSSSDRAAAELNRLGLEHFGFDVEDIEADISRLSAAGVRIVLAVTEVTGGAKLAYIEGPDDVLIELVQPPG